MRTSQDHRKPIYYASVENSQYDKRDSSISGEVAECTVWLSGSIAVHFDIRRWPGTHWHNQQSISLFWRRFFFWLPWVYGTFSRGFSQWSIFSPQKIPRPHDFEVLDHFFRVRGLYNDSSELSQHTASIQSLRYTSKAYQRKVLCFFFFLSVFLSLLQL